MILTSIHLIIQDFCFQYSIKRLSPNGTSGNILFLSCQLSASLTFLVLPTICISYFFLCCQLPAFLTFLVLPTLCISYFSCAANYLHLLHSYIPTPCNVFIPYKACLLLLIILHVTLKDTLTVFRC